MCAMSSLLCVKRRILIIYTILTTGSRCIALGTRTYLGKLQPITVRPREVERLAIKVELLAAGRNEARSGDRERPPADREGGGQGYEGKERQRLYEHLKDRRVMERANAGRARRRESSHDVCAALFSCSFIRSCVE
jgi:IS5 family transposase